MFRYIAIETTVASNMALLAFDNTIGLKNI